MTPPKPLNEQVVVLTGASSGIGRAAALAFGRAGAGVVLAARNGQALDDVARQIEASGGRALPAVTDVAEWLQVERLAQTAFERFGRIDTWVNGAGVSEYALFDDMTLEEIERIIQVNLLGTLYGVKAVLPIMKRQGGGTIINLGSVLSQRSIALQSVYCATKHGVKGFTEALRLEMDREKTGVNVTLILPGPINTPFYTLARSHMAVKPKPVPPVYEAQAVAEAILAAAQRPLRDVTIGGAGKMMTVLEALSPALFDRLMEFGGAIFKTQQTDEPETARPDNLFTPAPTRGRVDGDWPGRPSWYTRLFELRPNRKRLLLAAGAVAGAALWLRPKGGPEPKRQPTTRHQGENTMAEHSASVTVNAPVHQVYQLFSHFNDFPKFMSFVKEVTYKDDQTSHWVVDVVGTHEWDAVNENWVPDQQIGWKSTDGMENSGVVTFETTGANHTKVSTKISYNPPAGVLGDLGDKLGAGKLFETKLQHDLDHFAQMVAEAPAGSLDPTSSSYLFHDDSAAAKSKTTESQESTMKETGQPS